MLIEHHLGVEGRNPGVRNPISILMTSRHGRGILRHLDELHTLLHQVPLPTPTRKLDNDYPPLSYLHLPPRLIHPLHTPLLLGWTDSHYQQTTGDSMDDGVWQKIGRSHLNWSHNRSYQCFTLATPSPILQAQERGSPCLYPHPPGRLYRRLPIRTISRRSLKPWLLLLSTRSCRLELRPRPGRYRRME
jgi:hypothetical protein